MIKSSLDTSYSTDSQGREKRAQTETQKEEKKSYLNRTSAVTSFPKKKITSNKAAVNSACVPSYKIQDTLSLPAEVSSRSWSEVTPFHTTKVLGGGRGGGVSILHFLIPYACTILCYVYMHTLACSVHESSRNTPNLLSPNPSPFLPSITEYCTYKVSLIISLCTGIMVHDTSLTLSLAPIQDPPHIQGKDLPCL